MTTLGKEARLESHKKSARSSARRKTPLYDWMEKHGPENIETILLEETVADINILATAEIKWIADFKRQGYKLLNLSTGGLGTSGHSPSPEQRKAQAERQTGKPGGLSRPGEANPFYGEHHTEEQRKKWSEERKGTYVGALNPNFGKFGPDHPAYGKKKSAETRKILSEARLGELNPNFGRQASAETRAKMSAVRKGRPMPSSARSAHTRWHTSKNVFKASCVHCVADGEASVTPMNEASRDS